MRQIIFSLLSICVVCLSFGCKDMSVDEYNEKKTQKDLADLQPAEGRWVGDVSSDRTGEKIGSFEFNIERLLTPGISTASSNILERVANSNKASLRGDVTLINDVRSTAIIQNANFVAFGNTGSGTFTGSISLPSQNNKKREMTISGTISGNQFSGQIKPSGNDSGFTGKFLVIRDGSLPGAVNSGESRAGSDVSFEYRTYVGSFLNPICKGANPPKDLCGGESKGMIGVKLTINTEAPTPEETFYNSFIDQKTAVVQVLFDDFLSIVFPSGLFTQPEGTLKADVTVQGSITTQESIKCFPTATSYHCNFINSSRGTSWSFDLQPQVSRR